MAELADREKNGAYRPAEMLQDLHAGIWSELEKSPVAIDLYRRNIQRVYVDLLTSALDNPSTDSDLPALARGDLEQLLKQVNGVVGANKETTPIARLHLEDIKIRIEHALDPYPSMPSQRTVIEFPSRRGLETLP